MVENVSVVLTKDSLVRHDFLLDQIESTYQLSSVQYWFSLGKFALVAQKPSPDTGSGMVRAGIARAASTRIVTKLVTY
jgi:hypothetical protein